MTTPTKQALLERWMSGGLPPVADKTCVSAITPEGRGPTAEASLLQEDLWYMTKERGGHDVSSTLVLAGFVSAAIDRAAFAAALDDLADRHETLRTTFREADDGSVWQVIHEEAGLEPQYLDLTDHDVEAAEAMAIDRATEVLQTPFDMTTGPLVRTSLYRVEAERYFIAVMAHHSVGDGWSLGVALTELQTLYEQRVAGRSAPPEPMPIQYRDYAAWHRDWAKSDDAKPHVQYWLSVVESLGTTGQREERPRPTPDGSIHADSGPRVAGVVPVALGPDLTAQVRELAQHLGVSLFCVLLGAYNVVLRTVLGGDRVVAGVPVANRKRPETQAIIGQFADLVVIPCDLGETDTFGEVTRRIRKAAAASIAHEEFTLGMFEAAFDIQMNPWQLCDATFNLQPPLPNFHLAGAAIEQVELDRGAASGRLGMHLWNDELNVTGGLNHRADRFSSDEAEQFVCRYIRVLELVVADAGESDLAGLVAPSVHMAEVKR